MFFKQNVVFERLFLTVHTQHFHSTDARTDDFRQCVINATYTRHSGTQNQRPGQPTPEPESLNKK